MSGTAPVENPALSVLKLNQVLFDEVSFVRHGFPSAEEQKLDMQIGYELMKAEDGKYRVVLRVMVEREEEYTAKISVSAFVEIDEKSEWKDTVLEKNAVAILFPYIRSELTLLTAQPGVKPVLLPALNINALLDHKITQMELESGSVKEANPETSSTL